MLMEKLDAATVAADARLPKDPMSSKHLSGVIPPWLTPRAHHGVQYEISYLYPFCSGNSDFGKTAKFHPLAPSQIIG